MGYILVIKTKHFCLCEAYSLVWRGQTDKPGMSGAEKWCGERECSECWGRADVVSDTVSLSETMSEIASRT